MARLTTPLTATKIKEAKPKEKDYKLFDGGGLFLLVSKSGGKHWKLKYRFHEKEKTYTIGAYPAVTLANARSRREELKTLIAKNIDPNEKKKQVKAKIKAVETKKENTFYNVSQTGGSATAGGSCDRRGGSDTGPVRHGQIAARYRPLLPRGRTLRGPERSIQGAL